MAHARRPPVFFAALPALALALAVAVAAAPTPAHVVVAVPPRAAAQFQAATPPSVAPPTAGAGAGEAASTANFEQMVEDYKENQNQSQRNAAVAPFKPSDCKKLLNRLRKTQKTNIMLLKALLVLSYFLACASLASMVFVLVRVHILAKRSAVVLRAAFFFVLMLVLSATLMIVMRELLRPVDLTLLNIRKSTFDKIQGFCAPRETSWPENVAPFMGEPPIRTWPFYLLVCSSYAGALMLASSLGYVYWDEHGGSANDGKHSGPIFECKCPPATCVHT